MAQSIMHDQRDGPIGGEVREKAVKAMNLNETTHLVASDVADSSSDKVSAARKRNMEGLSQR